MNDLMTRSFFSYPDLKKEPVKDLESGLQDDLAGLETPVDSHLLRFFKEAAVVMDEMCSIRDLLARLHSANDAVARSLHNPDGLRDLRRRIDADIVLVLKTARAVRGRLEDMDRSNAASRRFSGCREGSPADRTRTAVTNGLRKRLRDLMMDFQALRQLLMAECREAAERCYFTMTGEAASEEVIERIMGEGEEGTMMKKATVEEMQDRRAAAKEVERSLLELHQVFLDMAVMVETQGEQMDDIEHHVASAGQYVREGSKELKCAKEHRSSGRKWLCIGVFMLLLLLVLVTVIGIATCFSNLNAQIRVLLVGVALNLDLL